MKTILFNPDMLIIYKKKKTKNPEQISYQCKNVDIFLMVLFFLIYLEARFTSVVTNYLTMYGQNSNVRLTRKKLDSTELGTTQLVSWPFRSGVLWAPHHILLLSGKPPTIYKHTHQQLYVLITHIHTPIINSNY